MKTIQWQKNYTGHLSLFQNFWEMTVRVQRQVSENEKKFQTVPHCTFFFFSLLSLFIVLCWFLTNDRFVDHQ